MTRVLCTLTLFLLSAFVLAQETESSKISMKYIDEPLITILNRIEDLTGVYFYYNAEWLRDYTITGELSGNDINSSLTKLLSSTNLNFYKMDGDKIYLTQNNIIYDSLPDNFFQKKADDNEYKKENLGSEVFFVNNKTSNVKFVKIGKSQIGVKKNSYNLSGYVRNTEDGRAIPNLPITFNQNSKYVITDINGFYQINLPFGKNVLRINSLGKEMIERNILLYADGTLDLELSDRLEMLDEVVLNSKIEKNVRESITGKTEIDIEQSKNIPLVLGERDVLKVATALPGISTAGEGASGFNVRGGKTDQNLILLDEAVMYNSQHFFGLFSALNPFVLGEVDIYKGSIPAEYGGRLSSVFDIETKKGNVSKLTAEASVGPVTANLAIEVPVVKEKSSVVLGGRGAYANYILKSLNEESLKRSQASFYDGIASYHHKIDDKNMLKGTFYYSNDKFSITSDSLFGYSNRLTSIQWSHRFSDKNKTDISITNSKYNFTIGYDADSNANFNFEYIIQETGLKFKNNLSYNDKLEFGYGLSSKLYNVEPGSLQPLNDSEIEKLILPREKGLESAAFLSAKIDLSDRLTVNGGFRFSVYNAIGKSDQFVFESNQPKSIGSIKDTMSFGNNEIVKTYTAPELRISTRYLLANNLSIKASYGNTTQFVHTLSNNTTVSPTDTWKLSNFNIKPQRAHQISLGIFKNFKENLYEFSIDGFYKRSKNIVDFKVGAEVLLNDEIETEILQGEGKAYGIEVLLRKNIGKLNGWLGYTFSRSFIKLDSEFSEERVNRGNYFPSNFDKPHDISAVLNYKFTKRLSVSTNFVYQTGRPITFPVGNFNYDGAEYVTYSDRNAFRIPDFYRLDVGLNLEGNHKLKKLAHSFWTFSIYNVLGRNNPYSVFFVTKDGKVEALQSSIFSIPVPTITYNLKF
ncbi:carboxypeptidase-like regulatory domain-containing protein [Aquimarina sp. 2-A2]|uniref:TonB-dependent receptor n=1 Tax=Aquimarina sp. 2-A2 TaxID=3382644 RepID=UPI00387F298C